MINPKISRESYHFPVMLDEVINICSPAKGGTYIDCTFGAGGYSKRLLKFPKTKVIAVDRDKFVLNYTKELKKEYPNRFSFHLKKFSEINMLGENSSADAVIFDLGLSSMQINNLNRGFSFKSKDMLDMSMGLSTRSVQEVINKFKFSSFI